MLLTAAVNVRSRWSVPVTAFSCHRNFTRRMATTPNFAWCSVASTDLGVVDILDDDDAFRSIRGEQPPLDITNSANWMEYVEDVEHRRDQPGGAGAYDTFRCDLVLNENSGKHRWRIWGQDFHLRRLRESFRSIGSNDDKIVMEKARRDSENIIKALLHKAETASILNDVDVTNVCGWEDVPIQLIKLTLLWSPSQDDMENIVVRGHACSSAEPFGVHSQAAAKHIVVSIAAKSKDDDDLSIPNRLKDPQHKIASWTRLRKQMERPETYKPPGVSEVLMVRHTNDGTEILEGASSNVFVVYKDGTLRTPIEGVLHGYARHLVLECAESCGLKIDLRPILLQDAEKDLWAEAFVTSSSRLIFPISRILLRNDENSQLEEYWSDPVLSCTRTPRTNHPNKRSSPKWQQLLDKILSKLYPSVC